MKDQERKDLEELLFEKKTESFAKKLFLSRFDAASIFPYPDPVTDAEKLFLDKLDAFAASVIDDARIDREAKIPDEVVEGLKKLGVMGMTVPKEYGGLGMTQRAYCKATELLARHSASVTLFVNVHQSIGLKSLILFGTPEQKKQWLPLMAKGEAIGAFSLTEPDAGSDARAVKTRAEFIPEKRVWKLNGTKQWSTNASIAHIITLMAKSEGKITAFLVTPSMKGFEVTAKNLDKVGMRGTWTANLKVTDMEVPAENVIGKVGGGLKVALSVLDYGRTTFGAMCTGIGKELLEKAVSHANTRIQFDRPLASFGLVKKKIARMGALVLAMEASTYLTAGLIDRGVEDIMLESAILKVFASEALWQVIYDTMQILGGRSLFKDAPYERIMRDARLNQIGEGSNEVMRVFIAAVGLREAGVLMKELWDQKKVLKLLKLLLIRFPNVPVESKELKCAARKVEKGIARFGKSVTRLLIHYKEDVVEKQLELERIAESAMALYVAAATLSKCDREKKNFDLAKLFVRLAMENLNAQLDALFSCSDRSVENVSDRLSKEGGKWGY